MSNISRLWLWHSSILTESDIRLGPGVPKQSSGRHTDTVGVYCDGELVSFTANICFRYEMNKQSMKGRNMFDIGWYQTNGTGPPEAMYFHVTASEVGQHPFFPCCGSFLATVIGFRNNVQQSLFQCPFWKLGRRIPTGLLWPNHHR